MSQQTSLQPVGVVLNGAAGTLLTTPGSAGTLERLLREAGFAPDFVPPEHGTLPERIRHACGLGNGLVIVGGGDGTIACAAETAAELGVTLGILPLGTMNVLAWDLGLPVGDLSAAVAVLRDGAARAIDVASADGRLFLCASMLGLPARLARYREAARGKGLAVRLWLRFARAALRGLARYRARTFVMRIDGQPVEMRAASLMISVNAIDPATGRLFGRSTLSDGRLVLYGVPQIGLGSLFRMAGRAVFGRIEDDPALTAIPASEIEILRVGRSRRVRNLRIMNDGEVTLARPPLTYRVRPGAVRIMAPRTGTGE